MRHRGPLLALGLLLASCESGGGGSCAAVGEPCQVFCCTSLFCQANESGGYCTKGCRCNGGASLCAPSTFLEGCPQGSVCRALAGDGTGECVQLCDSSPCRPGQVRCRAGDGPDAGASACELVPPAGDLGTGGEGP